MVHNLVEITDMSVGYERHGRVVPAVHEMSMSIQAGEVVAVVGESGSGKTTTANAVIGLLPKNGRITAGRVVVDGIETTNASPRVLRALRASSVGLVPQDPMVSLNRSMHIGRQVAEAVKLRGVRGSAVMKEVYEALSQAGLDSPEIKAHQYPHELSGGQRQRALIAIALAGRPKLIIADEPTSALDVTVQARILDHLEGLVRQQGISLLIITHDLGVAADRADRVIVMQTGRVVEEGDPDTILVDPRADYTRQLIESAPGLAHDGQIVPRYATAPPPALLPEPLLVIDRVSKTYALPRSSGRKSMFRALDDVSLTVRRGQTHALVGESGSGKTTTLRIALGLEQPDAGSVRFDGIEISGLSRTELRPLRRRFNLVHQNPYAALDPRYTIGESIAEPLAAFGVGNRTERARRTAELLDQVALPSDFTHRLPGELSGGQRQRVAIARALALNPELILLDEPVSALDVSVQQQVLDLLIRLQEELGLSYLFISHDLAVVADISHSVTVLSSGKVAEQGTAGDVFTSPRTDYTRELLAAIPGRRVTR